MHVEVVGSGPRLVLVHGSAGNSGWPAQRRLAERYTLVMPTRSGYPPNPPLEHIDFEAQAGELLDVLEPGDHVFGHSYGGIVALLAAKSAVLRSLAVAEPPAFGVAPDHPAVAELVGELAPLCRRAQRGLRRRLRRARTASRGRARGAAGSGTFAAPRGRLQPTARAVSALGSRRLTAGARFLRFAQKGGSTDGSKRSSTDRDAREHLVTKCY